MRAFCTDGSAAFAFASGRALTATEAGFAEILDLLARRGIATLPRLRRLLDAHDQLNETADPHLLGVRELLEDDLLQRRERGLGIALAQAAAVGDLTCQLRLGQGHWTPSVVGEMT